MRQNEPTIVAQFNIKEQWILKFISFFNNLVDDENIVYAQLELPSGGKVQPGPRVTPKNATEDDIVYANIADSQPKPGKNKKNNY